MEKFFDCNNVAYPEFTKGSVVSCKATKGAFPENSVYTLVLAVSGEKKPQPGQFYMLHPLKSDTLLGRPISVFHF
mgnify:FL=1